MADIGPEIHRRAELQSYSRIQMGKIRARENKKRVSPKPSSATPHRVRNLLFFLQILNRIKRNCDYDDDASKDELEVCINSKE